MITYKKGRFGALHHSIRNPVPNAPHFTCPTVPQLSSALTICYRLRMETNPRFRRYDPDQLYLLPPDMRKWLPDDDLVHFIVDVVNQIDLKEVLASYEENKGGYPAYHPRMMVALLL